MSIWCVVRDWFSWSVCVLFLEPVCGFEGFLSDDLFDLLQVDIVSELVVCSVLGDWIYSVMVDDSVILE